MFLPSMNRGAAVAALAAAVSLAPPAPAQSLTAIPTTEEMIEVLRNPTASLPLERILFPGLTPIPGLAVHSIFGNTLTGQPLLFDNGEISYEIPAVGVSPFVNGEPERALALPLYEGDFITDRVAAVRLGKALFWDMQVGSDGVQACGSCHFHAGADNRTKNQLNPATLAGDSLLSIKGKNQEVDAGDFPFHKLANPNTQGEPLLNPENVLSDSNDVLSSMGVRWRQFVDIPTPGPSAFIPGTNPPVLRPDFGIAQADPVGDVFQNVRRVEPRNTPTFFAASHNFNNFWDGRARQDFNGGTPHGASDPDSHVFVDGVSGLEATRQLIRFSSFASLATGPALSNFEMSFDGRNWAKIGKKLLQAGVTPLANQLVDPTDSVLGPLSNQNITPGMPGLSISYAELIEQAFRADLWSNLTDHTQQVPEPADPFDGVALVIVPGAANPAATDQFAQKESNFSLFFGLSTQAYTQILNPDQSPFDQFHEANPDEFLGIVEDIDPVTPGVQVVGLSERQLFGYDIFQNTNLSRRNPLGRGGSCNICHFGPNLTENSLVAIHGVFPPDPITGEDKLLSGFLLEEALNDNARVTMEIDAMNQALDGIAAPDGIALLDKGIYNIGVRPIAEDLGRGADDPFGLPLSIAALALRKGGFPVGEFSDPLNPVPPLPAHLEPYVNDFPTGALFPNVNQTTFLPDTVAPSNFILLPTGTYPTPNRVGRMGNFKVPSLKNVELTGPYFHNGGVLTLRQLIDFYARGGDFPITNESERDPLIRDLQVEFETFLTEEDKVALVDFLLAQTDERVRFKQAPFDHPEIIIPIDGTASDNVAGRAALLADASFRQIAAVGAAGSSEPIGSFLDISNVEGSPGPDHFDAVTLAPGMSLSAPAPGVAGSLFTVNVTGAQPNRAVGILISLSLGSSTMNLGNCGGIEVGLARPFRIVARTPTDANGDATFSIPVPAGAAGSTYHMQAVQPASCQASGTLSNTF